MAAHSPEKHSNGRDRVGGTPGHVRARASESSLASQWTKSGKAKGGQDVSGLVGYQMGDCLGKGAFGSVYRAINFRNAETVAIKQIKLENLPQGELRVIMSEIDLLKNLDHPNIVKYHGYTRDTEVLNIILEYCENGSLHTILKNFGKFPEDLVAIYMSQVLTGLLYLHEQGVIHRDIKGANILTTKEGLVKLADFGVATKATGMNEASVVGTPYWMAPEVIELAGATTGSDIWSLGCTVIELLDGKPPYHKLQPMPALFRIVNDDHPPLPGGASPAVRDFLLQCFQKDPNLRVSAKKLLRHPWIVNAKRAEAVKPTKATDIKEAIQSVQVWNEALRSPTNGSFRKSIRPDSLSPVPSRAAAVQTPSQMPPPAFSRTQVKGASNFPEPRPDPDMYRSPELDSENNWDDDFATPISPEGLQLPRHLRPQDHFNGQLSAAKLRAYVKYDAVSEDSIVEEEEERTVRSPIQLMRTDPLQKMNQFTPTHGRPTSTTATNGSPMRQTAQLKNLAIRTSTKTPQTKSRLASGARPATLFREESTEDYSDLVTDDAAFRRKVNAMNAMRTDGDSFSPKLFDPSDLKLAPRSTQQSKVNGSVRRRPTPQEEKENQPIRRTQSELEIEKYAENEVEDLSDLLDKNGHSLQIYYDDSESDRSTLIIGRNKISMSIPSMIEDEEEDDPFAQLDEGFDEMDFEENIARDKYARLCQSVQGIIGSLNTSLPEDDLFRLSEELLQYLFESPEIKEVIVTSHGLLPILEVLETCTFTDLQLRLLRIINELIFENQGIQESLCFIGGIPIVTEFAGTAHSREIRQEAAAFVRQMCQTSTLTLQMFISCGGLKVLVEFIEEDIETERDLVLIGVNGVWNVFELQGPTPKNDFCRILSRSSVLSPLSEVLSQILYYPDEDREVSEIIEGRIASIFLLFSQSENYVKEIVAERSVLSSILNDLPRMTRLHQITMLKFIKNLSMLSTTHDSLQNAGAVERLIDLLRTVGLRDTSTRDVANQILNIMYNLCRLSKQTQEFAAKQGIIPLLMKAGESGWAVREFALPIICDMAHSGKSGRKNLWSNNGLHFYVRLLADKNWQTTALDAIFVWLQEETARVEQRLLEGSFSDAIVKCFTNDEISSDAFENFLEPLQKIVRLSPAVASCLARREIFARTVQKLQIKKPIVRVSLLRIIRDICEATEDRCAVLLRSSNLTESLHRMQQDQVLVKEIASELLKFAEGPCIRSPMRRSSSSTLNHAGQYPPLSLPLNSQQPIRSSYFDQSPALLSPRSRPRTSVSSVASSISTSSISTTASLSNKTPTSIRPVSRDSNSGSAPGTGSTGLGGSGPKSRLPRTSATRIGRLSAGQQARPDGNQKEENVTPTHKPWGGGTGGSTSTAVPKPSPAVNPRRTRRQTSGGEVRRYT